MEQNKMKTDTKTVFKVPMVTKIFVGTFSSLILAGSFLFPSTSQAEIKILNYDGNGNILGSSTYSNSKQKNGAQATRPSTGATGFNPDTAYEPGELVLSNPPKGFERKIQAMGFRIMETVTLRNLDMDIVRIQIPNGMAIPEAIRSISLTLPGVTVDANTQFDPSGMGFVNRSTANPRVIAGWDKLSPTCGKGLIIGQIDSGVDVNHPALKGQKIIYRSFPKAGRKAAPPDHGTSIAGILVGKANWGGLMPGATLYAANMFEINERGKKVGSAFGLLRSIDWLASQKVNAVNLSIAGADNKIIRQAFEAARKKKLLLIAAVGNWGRSDRPAFPAAYKYVVAVTAVKENDLIYKFANSGNYVDFAEPGVAMYTAAPGGGGKVQSGTSLAVPYITVMAAILNKAGKAPTGNSLRKLLSGATKDLGKPGKDKIFGYGLVYAKPRCTS